MFPQENLWSTIAGKPVLDGLPRFGANTGMGVVDPVRILVLWWGDRAWGIGWNQIMEANFG